MALKLRYCFVYFYACNDRQTILMYRNIENGIIAETLQTVYLQMQKYLAFEAGCLYFISKKTQCMLTACLLLWSVSVNFRGKGNRVKS